MTTERKLNFTSLECGLLYKSFGDHYIAPGTAARGLLPVAPGNCHRGLSLGILSVFATWGCKSYEFIQALRQYTYAWQIDCLTACSSPPTREFFLPDNSPGGRSLISDPSYRSKTIRRVIISSRPSYTSCKVSVFHVFNQGVVAS